MLIERAPALLYLECPFLPITCYWCIDHGSHVTLITSYPSVNKRTVAYAIYPIYTWWRHQMETFSALLALCAGYSTVTGEFPTQRPVTRALMFSLIRAWINSWVNNREAGDLRRHLAHYDVNVTQPPFCCDLVGCLGNWIPSRITRWILPYTTKSLY